MKCPKCGNEIKEDHLYCDICGEEIRIVPDFDATVDENLDISFTGVLDTAGVIEGIQKVATKEIDKEIDKEATREIDIKKKKTITDTLDVVDINQINNDNSKVKTPVNPTIIKALVITGAICVVLTILGIAINKRVNEYTSVDYQYEKAFEKFENEDYEESIKILKRVLTLAPEDSRIKLLIANNYFELGKYDEANAVLFELRKQYPDDANITEAIIRNYEVNGDYQAINAFLTEVNNPELSDKYSKFLANDVNFSIEEGVYAEEKELELSANDGCKIYYSIDASETESKTIEYTEPILLTAGEHIVKAVAVNEYGIKSNILTKEYVIDFFVPDAPTITTKAGTYNVPALIEVNCADYDTCYYTIDGEAPTLDDKIYQGPIAMYIGKHTYKFATISNKGVSSEVAEANYSLELITLIDMDYAKNNLINWMNATGKNISDLSYECEQGYVYNNQSYYIINEYKRSEGGKEETGNHYAVDVLTGLTFRAILNKSTGEYTLEALI